METKNQLSTNSNWRPDGHFIQKLISDLIKLVRPSGDLARKKLGLFIEREEYSDGIWYPTLPTSAGVTESGQTNRNGG